MSEGENVVRKGILLPQLAGYIFHPRLEDTEPAVLYGRQGVHFFFNRWGGITEELLLILNIVGPDLFFLIVAFIFQLNS